MYICMTVLYVHLYVLSLYVHVHLYVLYVHLYVLSLYVHVHLYVLYVHLYVRYGSTTEVGSHSV